MKLKFVIILASIIVESVFSRNPIRDYSMRARIAGGTPAYSGQFPFQVGLVSKRFDDRNVEFGAWCGGSLISDQIVLTAGHCLHGAHLVHVFLGFTDFSQREPGTAILTMPAENMLVHEHFNIRGMLNDIALIKLSKKVSFTKYIEPISLPRMTQTTLNLKGMLGWISGWGRLGDMYEFPEHLQFARRFVLPHDDCENYYGSGYLRNGHICIDGSNKTSSCPGDSGGPLMVQDTDGAKILVGITSFGVGFCENGAPTVFTRITAHLKWISENSGIPLKY